VSPESILESSLENSKNGEMRGEMRNWPPEWPFAHVRDPFRSGTTVELPDDFSASFLSTTNSIRLHGVSGKPAACRGAHEEWRMEWRMRITRNSRNSSVFPSARDIQSVSWTFRVTNSNQSDRFVQYDMSTWAGSTQRLASTLNFSPGSDPG
jgi:hypothetical protein